MRRFFTYIEDSALSLSFAQKVSIILIAATLASLSLRLPKQIIVIYTVAVCGFSLVAVPLRAIRKRGVEGFILFLCMFLLAIGFVQIRNIPTPFPLEKAVAVKMRLVSYPRITGRAIQFRAVVLDVDNRRMRGRVLFSVPFTSKKIERGDAVEAQGMFFPLPFQRSEGYARYLRNSGIEAIFEGYSGRVSVLQETALTGPVHLANRMRRYIEDVHKGLLPPAQDAFATALLTGNRDFIPRELMEVFRRSGTMHILAVSGLHVGFLSLFLLFFLRLVRIPKLYAYILVGLFIVFFMIFIGERSSVRRASLMALCGIACYLFDRDRNYLNVLALSFIILWLINPLSLLNPGFLLSFSATFGILFLTPVLYRWLERFMPRYLAGSIAVTLSVQLFIFPVMAAYFRTFSYINLIANLPIVPLTGLSLALGVLTLLFYPLFLPLAVIIAEVNTVVIATIARLAAFFSHVPPLRVEGFPMKIVPVYLLCVTFGLWLLKKSFHEAPVPKDGL
jgi:competence protein ComEC